MKRKEDSFEDIAFELEKETSKSKFLPFVLLAIIGFSIVGAVFLMLSIPEKAKSKQPVSQLSHIISPSKKLEDKKTEVKKFAESLTVSPEKSGPFLWTVDKAVSLPMDKDKGGAVLEDVLKEFGKPVEAGSWIHLLPNHEVRNYISLFWKDKNGNIGNISLIFAEFDGVYKLTSKFFNLSSNAIKVDKKPDRDFLWTQEYIDSLVIGAREGTDKGTAYDEIVSNVGLPFYQIISGENNQLKLRITYNNPKGWKERNKLQTVILEFYNQEDGTWRLVSKQSQ
ncbi:hypothetical protein J1C95_06030 [Streptococcus sanguinis]|jgi:hypothetical protein|uniref:Conjugative transposon protein TcpC n=1 Tax=Streptococcus sanguinis TaxID=1305 RepID=A0AB74DIS4_STRSA|nr:hypothetical protein [Streptococcus sanguinis]RSI28283.1 hypothetical protein D8879_10945 [Streptococcus sanguinis]RSI33921.1 hypothetical protein D8878_09795 [Streptococcus sanguinis]